ncbi:hypothetical protein K437DRAFT_257151 [Tilletiaria anomala UBC 951]|uniref:Uncharacterized protein n=1 Tax=Tilletiaria anomala (strain ATCC 24038 / CBS 436.72 / UBC 951) TaxID=1037660 RepID=A0A066VUZ4_TILAU|nr:uncharacterized protein K437DRAFT_257151 [Tilletiaria anomala UBC 951]KDN44113.1 hypothetical protein K437DRAFT_257151 [Tilletiaria anomala UBC 951]
MAAATAVVHAAGSWDDGLVAPPLASAKQRLQQSKQQCRLQRAVKLRNRSSSIDSVASQTHDQYKDGTSTAQGATWLDDELCSVCSNPVKTAGSLYCSQVCRHQDELASQNLAHDALTLAGHISSTSVSPSAFAPIPGTAVNPSSSSGGSTLLGLDTSWGLSTNGVDQLDTLRYTALPLTAAGTLGSPMVRTSHHNLASADTSAPLSPTFMSRSASISGSSTHVLPRSGRQPSKQSMARWAYPFARPCLISPQQQQQNQHQHHSTQSRQHRSSSSSSSRSSLSEEESPDPATPSPNLWASSAPHAHAMGEPSALMLPPSLHAEMKGMQKLPHAGRQHTQQQQLQQRQLAETMPTPSTLASFMRYTRRPSSTNVPAPILFSSPVLAAINKVSTGGRTHIGAKSPANALGASNSDSCNTYGRKSKPVTPNGSGSDTSDLDLSGGDLSPGSSGFELEQPGFPAHRRSPLSQTVTLPNTDRGSRSAGPATAQPSTSASNITAATVTTTAVTIRHESPAGRASWHSRMSSDSVLSSRSSRSTGLTPRRPTVAHAATVPLQVSPSMASVILLTSTSSGGCDVDSFQQQPSLALVPTTVRGLTKHNSASSASAGSTGRSIGTAPVELPSPLRDLSGMQRAQEAAAAAAVAVVEAAQGDPRGRSKARGPRSSSCRRSPSPPRRGDRRRSRAASDAAAAAGSIASRGSDRGLPSAAVPLGLDSEAPSDALFGADDDNDQNQNDEEEEERTRGRQGKRFNARLSRGFGAGGLVHEAICEQVLPDYGHDDA